jgi:hypothetical protein
LGHFEGLGGYTVGFETFGETVDAAPMFKGLPADRWQSPHWGVVIKGRSGCRCRLSAVGCRPSAVRFAPL